MAKISERMFLDDSGENLIIEKKYDQTDGLHRAQVLRATLGEEQRGADKKCVGVISMDILAAWLKEAGVAWDDPARADVIKRKLLSGEFDKFRVWKGKY